MFELLTSVEGLLHLVETYGSFVVFSAVLMTGETAIFLASLLVVDGKIAFMTVFLFSSLAALVTDVFWFLLGRYFPTQFLPKKVRKATGGVIERTMHKIFGKSIFVPILCLKFFYGVRILSVVYFARTPLSFMRFLVYDIIGTLGYVLIFMVLGQGVGSVLIQVFPGMSFSGVLGIGTVIVLLGVLIVRRLKPNPLTR